MALSLGQNCCSCAEEDARFRTIVERHLSEAEGKLRE